MKYVKGTAALAAAVVLGWSIHARADVIFSGTGTDVSDGAPLSAQVDFSLTGNDFRIVLTNENPALSPASVLTNLGVTVAPQPATALPSGSGTIALTAGSSFVGATATETLGQEWAYLSGGAASSGFGVGTGDGNLCGGTDPGLCTSNSTKQPLDGAAYGLVGVGSDVSNPPLSNTAPYVENSVTIDILLAANSTFALSQITSVDFQYGTQSGEGDITCTATSTNCRTLITTNQNPVPEPASVAALGTALLAFGALVAARRSRSS